MKNNSLVWLKTEIDDLEQSKDEELPPEPEIAVWRECLDEVTKHPYYWHTQSQEVTWIKPTSYEQDLVSYNQAVRKWKKTCEDVRQRNEERKKKAVEKKKQDEEEKTMKPRTAPKVELEPDQGNMEEKTETFGKMGKFNFLKTEEEKKEASKGPANARLTFKVKKVPNEPEAVLETPAFKKPKITEQELEKPDNIAVGKQRTVTQIAAEIKKKKQQIAITNARLLLQKRVEEQKLAKKASEDKIAKENQEKVKLVKEKQEKMKLAKEEISSPVLENKKRRIFQEVKMKAPTQEIDQDTKSAVEKESTILKEKLEFLGGDIHRLSKFQVLIIALDTRISDFLAGHITESYMQSKLTELGQMLRSHEENAVPKNWTCTFDREEKRYRYTNQTTGKSQLTHPGEDDDKSSDSDSDSERMTDDDMKISEDKDDELYEMFQQEIKVIEEKAQDETTESHKVNEKNNKTREKTPETHKTREKTPETHKTREKTLETHKTREETLETHKTREETLETHKVRDKTPDNPGEKTPPPIPADTPPLPPPVPYDHYAAYVDPWAAGYNGYGMMPPYPEMPVQPPPPPPDDMMETYSPGNSDSEEDLPAQRESTPDDNLGVVSVKAPMRYSAPPIQENIVQKVVTDTAQKLRETTPTKPAVAVAAKKKKKKPDSSLTLGSGGRKKNMNSLVAKWNKANKNADVAMK